VLIAWTGLLYIRGSGRDLKASSLIPFDPFRPKEPLYGRPYLPVDLDRRQASVEQPMGGSQFGQIVQQVLVVDRQISINRQGLIDRLDHSRVAVRLGLNESSRWRFGV